MIRNDYCKDGTFSDWVIAIIISIMVPEPGPPNYTGPPALIPLILSDLLSLVVVGIYLATI